MVSVGIERTPGLTPCCAAGGAGKGAGVSAWSVVTKTIDAFSRNMLQLCGDEDRSADRQGTQSEGRPCDTSHHNQRNRI